MQNQSLGVSTDVMLSWSAPTENTDGTPVAFEGFNIYRSTTPVFKNAANGGVAPIAGRAPNAIPPTQLSYVDKGLPDGTYYYAISAWHWDTASNTGAESELTPTVSVTLTTALPIPKTATTPAVPGSLHISVTGSAPQ
jgi:hypothetical protein